MLSAPSFESVCKIGDEIKARYLDGNLDAVYIVYNEFKSAMSQNVVVERFLPIIPERDSDESANPELEGIEFAFEPTMELVLDSVLPDINAPVFCCLGIAGRRNGCQNDSNGSSH